MGGASSFVTGVLTTVTALLIALVAYSLITHYALNQNNPLSSFVNVTSTVVSTVTTAGSAPATTTVQSNYTQTSAALEQYALGLINADRQKYGLGNVTLSSEPSAQQHSDSMLVNNYFSHWDPYGMKPYMRYTLVGGLGAATENVAYRESESCGVFGCTGNVNVKQALQQMEYDMMYNDSACCNNGHRDNILDPNHNQVSIGIAYNSSSVYFTEDFIDNYINWSNYGINPSTDEMYVEGKINGGSTLSTVQIAYDKPVENMTVAQLDNTSSYSYGPTIAGVVSSPLYYYANIETIVADQYSTSGKSFSVAFNMHNTISKNGPGEYTVLVWLNNTSGAGFVGSTYTVFAGAGGSIYTPKNV
ncbi:MAG: CAP domain-containing protein [Candidatus Marsarchaeota archaeon]|nr:CAP domain-containing protein [Candidatus Marsarchaeota archaeon]